MKFSATARWFFIVLLFFTAAGPLFADGTGGGLVIPGGEALPWWGWSLILCVFSFLLGILAVVAGVGGGVLFVPVVGGLFPFHLDFVRGAGLMVALAGALSASPRLLKKGLASLRLALPLALVGSAGSILGATVGLALPTAAVETALGSAILLIVLLMFFSKGSEQPAIEGPDRWARRWGLSGSYRDEGTGADISWTVHRTVPALILFVFIGFLAGMFGLGAGWANVPVLNLLMGAPLKVAVATSILILAVNDTAAAWVYFHNGAILPLIVVPSVVGMMLGTRIGARLLGKARPRVIRWIVIGFLALAGLRSLLGGLGVMG